MPIEVELKARVRIPDLVKEILNGLTAGETSIYRDAYYDRSDQSLTASGRELRIRTVTTERSIRTFLTYKAPAVDQASGSKPEYETEAADAQALEAILRNLGHEPLISFEKHCINWRFQTEGRSMLATLVTVPELDGTFLEIETMADDPDQVPAALKAVRATMLDLGIVDEDFTTELYTDAVRQQRDRR